MNALEKHRNEELNEKREKKPKEEKEMEKQKQQKQQQQTAAAVDVKSVTVVAEQISEDLNAPQTNVCTAESTNSRNCTLKSFIKNDFNILIDKPVIAQLVERETVVL